MNVRGGYNVSQFEIKQQKAALGTTKNALSAGCPRPVGKEPAAKLRRLAFSLSDVSGAC